MTERMSERNQSKTAIQIAGMVIIFCALANVAFYFLSDLYFDDRARRYGPGVLIAIPGVRVAFGVFTGAIGLMSILAALAPRWVGHGIPTATGLTALVAAYGAWTTIGNGTLTVVLVLVGILLPALAWLSLHKSRAAWSMLLSMCAVLGLMLMFGAPKVRSLVGIGLWTALILPGLLAVAAIALAMVHRDYTEA
ncbi:MAG: hypothetical protein H0T89_07550 [Deltaproteobacteria bacterium]|nr:hypothetical protein [Deltaproteobacteria bacterium]MDQ3297140.1 hypothetical protein [Myxococcota bacterium]